jgi:hypothetical protein
LCLSQANPFWDSKPELFSDIAYLRIPYQPCIVLFRKFLSGAPASNQRELRLHLNVVPTGAGVFKSRHILLHKYVNRIMISYLWRQIQLIIPSRRFRSIECRHFYLFWKYVTWSLFPRIMWYSLFHISDLSVLKHSFPFCQNFCAHVGHIQDEGLYTRYRSVAGVTELSNTFCTSNFRFVNMVCRLSSVVRIFNLFIHERVGNLSACNYFL